MFVTPRLYLLLILLAPLATPQTEDANQPRLLRPGLSQGMIQHIAFTADNRILVTDDGTNTTSWDTVNGLPLRTVLAVASRLTPGGNLLWYQPSGLAFPVARRIDLRNPSSPSPAVRIGQKPGLMLTDALDNQLLYRDRNTGQAFLVPASAAPGSIADATWIPVPSGKGLPEAAALNPAGGTVAIGDEDGRLRVYDYENKKTLFESTPGPVILVVAFSRDGKSLATLALPAGCVRLDRAAANFGTVAGRNANCDRVAQVTVREVAGGQESYSGKFLGPYRVVFTPNGGSLALVGQDSIQLLDLAQKKVTRTFSLALDNSRLEPGDPVNVRAAFSPDGKWLAESGHTRIFVIDTTSGLVVRSLADPPEARITANVLTRDGRLLAAVNSPNRVVVMELSPGVTSRVLKMNPDSTTLPVISSSGSTIAILGADRKVQVWNLGREQLLCAVDSAGLALNQWRLMDNQWRNMDLSGDGSLLALPAAFQGSGEQSIEIWDTRSCRKVEDIAPASPPVPEVQFFHIPNPYFADPTDLNRVVKVAIGESGRTVAWVTRGNVLRIWNRAGRRLVAAVRVPVPAVYSGKDKGGNHFMAGQEEVRLPVSEAGGPNAWLRFEQRPFGINGLNFSPDESMVATPDYDGFARLWSTADGKLLRTLGSVPDDKFFITNGTLLHAFTIGSVAFSSDSRLAVYTALEQSAPKIWDVRTGAVVRPLKGSSRWNTAAAFTADNKTVLNLCPCSGITAFDVATGEMLAGVRLFGDGRDWLANNPVGLFDGSPSAYRQLGWSFPGLIAAVPMEAFFADFYHPGLLTEILSGTRLKASRDLNGIDRRQAAVKIDTTAQAQPDTPINAPNVAVQIHITPPPRDDSHAAGTVRDVRLFRNGSLVQIWRQALRPSANGVVELAANVPIVAGPNELVAYGFNADNVQSTKGVLFVNGAPQIKRAGIAYVVVVGVNQYENADFNLKYAVADATLLGDKLAEQLRGTGRYSDVRVIPLLDNNATKSNLITALVQLSEGASGSGGVPRLAKARPEDAVFLFFAGHGWAHEGQFYLVPHDLGYAGQRARLASDAGALKTVLDHSIADRELSGLLQNIDAGLIALIIDACNSGQMLESAESRQGPFNAKGLAQLAWDKGMYVLTAAQSYQAALEARDLHHGYLTYALVEEGLRQRKADRDPENGEIDIREWFDYAASRVPEMQRERSTQARVLVQGRAAAEVQTPRAFYRYELGNHLSITGGPPAQVLDCSREPELKSGGGPRAHITFDNGATSSARKIFWLDNSGNRQLYKTLAPGSSWGIDSFTGHYLVVTDAGDQCVAIYVVGQGRSSVLIQK